MDQPAYNLPAQLTPFIGRTEELNELKSLLGNPDCRLLTLVGPGGSGKTRLAIEGGREGAAAFDGEAGLPAASGAHQRQQPAVGVAEQALQLVQLLRSANERSELRWQVVRWLIHWYVAKTE